MSKRQALQLYKSLISESKKFPSYNFRQYALRRIRDSFRENRNLGDEDVIRNKLEEAARSLETIKKQVIIGQLYSTDKLVIEHVMSQKK
ncbi:hypothetical protein Zmor_019668 [Zophobas morio]|uniref:Complex 1 LYR protein domain-containing protein n=1 Tax=Zophobas morio TaxID=2755281 RepID=A0AA38I2F1_9CUCU|nr:hypothetical protein Zmor_019668 [Zophobas morio]